MQSSITISQPWRPLLKLLGRSFGKSLAGLALATSIIGYGISGIPFLDGSTSAIALQHGYANASTLALSMQPSLIQHIHVPALSIPSAASLDLQREQLTSQAVRFFLGDGTYLYGQIAEPGQADTSYMVFDVNGQDIVGAFYMPNSSFDCFQGTIQSNELALTVHDSYSQERFPFEMALVRNNEAIAFDGTAVAPQPGIDGFQPIEGISDNDQRILSTCRADL